MQDLSTAQDIEDALMKALATQPIPEARISDFAAALSQGTTPVLGVEVCTLGIRVEHPFTGDISAFDVSEFLDDRRGTIRGIEIFPEGIPPRTDGGMLRVTHGF